MAQFDWMLDEGRFKAQPIDFQLFYFKGKPIMALNKNSYLVSLTLCKKRNLIEINI
jgi:hypothetical protein